MRDDISALRISPSQGSLPMGTAVQLGLFANKANGRTDLVPGNMALWSSSDDRIADVNRQGRLTPRSPGTVTITASYAGHRVDAVLEIL